MLTGKQKRYLRSLAHNIDPTFQIGKGGINENMIQQISETLEKRELIKIHILQNIKSLKKIKKSSCHNESKNRSLWRSI